LFVIQNVTKTAAIFMGYFVKIKDFRIDDLKLITCPTKNLGYYLGSNCS